MSSQSQHRIFSLYQKLSLTFKKNIAAAGRAYDAPPDATVDRGAEEAMGRWVMGQWVKLVSFWSGHMGRCMLTHDPFVTRLP